MEKDLIICVKSQEITSEIIDEVIDDLPQSIKSGENLLKAITPECTKIE